MTAAAPTISRVTRADGGGRDHEATVTRIVSMVFREARRPLALSIVLCCTLLAAATAADNPRPHDRAAPARLYEIAGDFVRIDPETLRPVRGQRAPLASDSWAWSFAPGHEQLALVSDSPGPELRLIELRTMRVIGDARLARRGSAWATAWVSPRRLLGVVVTRGDDTIVAGVDPATRRVLWRRRLRGSLRVGEVFHDGLVLILGPRRDVGPSRLVRISAGGGIRAAPLAEIRSGSLGPLDSRPGLAIDHAGARAFVVQAGSPVADVDLRTLQVRAHQPLLQGRAPDATTAATRDALWLGKGLLAVTCRDSRSSGAERPAGLTLADTRASSAREIDRRATDAVVARGTLLATSFRYSGRRTLGSGLTGYSLAGARKFHRYGDHPVSVQPIGSRVVVMTPKRTTLIDARTGRQLRRYRRLLGTPVFGDRSFPPTADG
jgi:hypothetical protein